MDKKPLKVRIITRVPPHREAKIKITTKAGVKIIQHLGLKKGVHYSSQEARWIWAQHNDAVKKNLLLAYLWDKLIELLKFIIKLRYE